MEELNLEDLNFDDASSLNIFNDDGSAAVSDPANPEGENTNPDAGAEDANAEGTDENTNTDGDGTVDTGQESVATQGKDNQVQTGKTLKDGEGSNSSSPKLNETEQLYSKLAAEFKSNGVLPGLDVSKLLSRSLEDIETKQ